MNHAQMKLGKKAPRIDKRTLKLSSYAAALRLVAPKRIDWSLGVNRWGMLKNDEIGDCAIAGPAHMEMAWATNNAQSFEPTDEMVVRDYSAITGYVPGDESTDNGSVMLDVMNYWRRTGICGRKIDGYVSVNPLNREHVKLAIDLFGGLALGFSMPVEAQSQEVWSMVDGAKPGSWGGHMTPAVNYGPAGIVVVTWGKLMTVTWEFVEACCDESFCALSQNWASQAKASPGLVDYQSLQDDLKAVAA